MEKKDKMDKETLEKLMNQTPVFSDGTDHDGLRRITLFDQLDRWALLAGIYILAVIVWCVMLVFVLLKFYQTHDFYYGVWCIILLLMEISNSLTLSNIKNDKYE